MKLTILIVIIFSSFQVFAQLKPMSLKEAQSLVSQPSPEIKQFLDLSPKTYDFAFQGKSSVNYTGQVMRQVLINDAKTVYSSMNRAQMMGDFNGAFNKLNAYYQYNFEINGLTPFLVKATGPEGGSLSILEGLYYADIFPKAINLKDKMAGVDNPLPYNKLLGWNLQNLDGVSIDSNQDGLITPDELMLTLMKVLANNISSQEVIFKASNGSLGLQDIRKAHITESGLDLAELSQKLLTSALSFSQAAGDYLSIDLGADKGLLADNNTILPEANYTTLQHHWDEAYGYFGAARNLLDYTDEQTTKGISLDSYADTELTDQQIGEEYWEQVYGTQDFEISLLTEKNLGISTYAARRDMGAKLKNTDFTFDIVDSLIRGRFLIQEKPQDYLKYSQAYSIVALAQWEKVLASSVIHYINGVLESYAAYETKDYLFEGLAKEFSEMKGLALSFQFNPHSLMTKQEFEEMHTLMGDTPVFPDKGDVALYTEKLLKVRDLIEKTYSFDSENVKGW